MVILFSKVRNRQRLNRTKTMQLRWISEYEKNWCVTKKREVFKKFSTEKKEWIIALFVSDPILYLNEAKDIIPQRVSC